MTLQLSGGRTIFWGDAEDNARKTTVANVLLSRPGKQIELISAELLALGPDGQPRPTARASGWRLHRLVRSLRPRGL